MASRSVLSRPRTTLEALQDVMLAEDPTFGGGTSRYIVRRDSRGFAAVPLVGGKVPAPFVDQDADGLPDIDALGRFVSTNGQAPPAPFFAADAPPATAYDTFGRSLDANKLLYDYVDTSHTFTASALRNMKPLLDPDPQDAHETLMYALGGMVVILGPRDGAPMTQKVYGDTTTGQVTVTYDAFHAETSPLLDLVYAVGQLLGDAPTDALLQYSSMLMKDHTADLARVVGAGLAFKDVADKHPEAVLPAKSTFWDEILDVLVKVEQEPGLLEDVLRSLGSDQALPLNGIFANYMGFRDHVSYDRKNLNGKPYNFDTASNNDMKTPVDRTKADTGWNRSAFLRFLQVVHDTNGVTACNKEGAVLHAQGVPILGSGDICAGTLALCALPGTRPFHECEVFKIDNLAKFYVDSIVGRANLYMRPGVLRNGIAGIGAATVSMMEQSSGITGFWDAAGAHTFRPTPQFLNRQVYFDIPNDSPNPGGTNYKTNRFLKDLMGVNSVGTTACPEKVINDPDPGAADAANDGKIHGLRQCAPGDSLQERDPDATFVLENFGSYAAMAPLINAFAIHGREDLFIQLMDTIYRHWQDDKGTASECDKCTKDGADSYEPLLVDALPGDLLPGLAALTKTLESSTIKVCTATDQNHMCTGSKTEDGITVMAEGTRGLVDPVRAKSAGLTDRKGGVTALRNDGTTNPQVTPVYLLTGALDAIDNAFATFPQKSPDDAKRLDNWHLGRSQLVDQFLSVKGSGASSAFADPSIPTITPTLVDMLRGQMLAHCPDSYAAPFTRCGWARDDLTNSMADSVKGPLFATTMDLVDAIRQDEGARTQLEALLQYMVDAASDNDALAAMLAASTDALQVLDDDQNLVPIFHALAPALAPTQKDQNGNVVKKSLVDAQLALLARIAGKYVDKQSGKEICASEMDPNQVLTQVLTRLVTPMTDDTGRATQAPLEVIMDVIADVNRKNPAQTDKLAADDYGAIASQVSSFLLDKQRGLEQFYEVVRKGTEE